LLPGHIEIKEAIGNKDKIRAIKPIVAPLLAVSATMGGKTIQLMVSANLAVIKRWCFADSKGYFKQKAGWGEEVKLIIESTAEVAKEKVHLHLLEYDSANDSNYIKDLGEVAFDEKGIAKAKFTTNGIKTELNKLWNERNKYELFFAVEYKEEGIQFADISRKNRGGKDTVYPAKTVSHSQLEKAKITYIDNEKDITSVRFLKSNGKDAYEVIKYGETIKLKVQTRNLEGTKLKLKNIIKNNFGNGLEEYAQNVSTTVKDETAEWTLNTANWKKWTKQPNLVSFYQVEIVESDGDKVKYPKENARLKSGEIDWTKLMTYQSLKLSDNAKISELAQTNAPFVVGLPMDNGENQTKITNECCLIDEKYFFSNYEKEFPTINKNGQKIPLPEKTKNSLRRIFISISEYYSNEKRCCNKYQIAYLLATSKHETGDTFDPVGEAHWLSDSSRKKYFEEMYDPVLGKNEKRRKMAKDNGNTKQGDGEKYFGRGYVQLTWKDNYQKMKDKFQVDFVNERERALEHEWAIKILIYGSEQGVFTGLKLSKYITDNKQDYYHARQVINGLDRASTIEDYAKKIEMCLKIKECNCGGANSQSQGNCQICKEEHFDLSQKIKWQTQFDSKWGDKNAQNVACKKTCDDILIKAGLKSTSKLNLFQTAKENNNHTKLEVDVSQSKLAIDYINKQLKLGNPIQLGVDHKLGYGYNEGTTDHFVVLVGKGCENGKIFYRFYDVGTKYEDKGASPNNKLFLNPTDYSLKGTTVYNGSTYVVTQVRKN
jgi:predicted chitinase